ncbi:RICIN domain-containing protein [Pinirhizobacter sp.]|jgi:hypothetical protein|uniref:RICIN domain-containing protein n=1 Tax=Pinirhizobacter sp. TaxID=2950432 RepID=UPI002F3E703A
MTHIRKTALFLAIAGCAGEVIGHELRLGGEVMSVGVHDQVGTFPINQLQDIFDQGVASASRRLVAGALAPQALKGADTTVGVGWVWGAALADPAIAARVNRMFADGQPVLVIRAGETQRIDGAIHSIFGAASPAEVAVYQAGAGGGLRVYAIDAPYRATGDLSLAMGQLVADVDRAITLSHATPKASTDDGEPVALPRIEVVDTEYAVSIPGASSTLAATVVRDSSRSKDVLRINTRSNYNLKPAHNGMSGGSLIVPYKYEIETKVVLDGTGTPAFEARLSSQYPGSDPRTDIAFSESNETKTSYGFNISSEISGGLQGAVPEASAKTRYGFTFGKEYTDTKSVAFTVRDYFVASRAENPGSNFYKAGWTFELAPLIASDARYFGKPVSEKRVTPMMRSASPEGFASWEIDGRYAGNIILQASAKITNASFNGSAVDKNLPDPRPQATVGLMVRADSPYLTRITTVFLQAQKGDGLCLWRDRQEAIMRTCPATSHPSWEDAKDAQWQLDEEGRYFNRGSGMCLTMLPDANAPISGSHVVLDTCSLRNSQRWEWRADRLYTLYDGASQDWRLHLDDGNVPRVRIDDSSRYQALPTNPNHSLLIPWSTYPSAPTKGTIIPSFAAVQPPIPEDWLRFNAVTSDQVWRMVVLRQGLAR